MMDNLVNTYEDEWANVVKGLFVSFNMEKFPFLFITLLQTTTLQTPQNANNSNNLSTHQNGDHKPKSLRSAASRDQLIGPIILLL